MKIKFAVENIVSVSIRCIRYIRNGFEHDEKSKKTDMIQLMAFTQTTLILEQFILFQISQCHNVLVLFLLLPYYYSSYFSISLLNLRELVTVFNDVISTVLCIFLNFNSECKTIKLNLTISPCRLNLVKKKLKSPVVVSDKTFESLPSTKSDLSLWATNFKYC